MYFHKRSGITRTVAVVSVIVIVVVAGLGIYLGLGYLTPPATTTGTLTRTTVRLGNLGTSIILFHYTGAALAAALNTYNDPRVNLAVEQVNFADVGGYRTAIATGQVDFVPILIDHELYVDSNKVGGGDVIGVLNYLVQPFNWFAFSPQKAAAIQANLSTSNPNGPFTLNDMKTIVCAIKGEKVLLFSAGGFDSIWLNQDLIPRYCPTLKAGVDFTPVYYGGNPATAVALVQKGEATAAFTSNPSLAVVIATGALKEVAWQGAFTEFQQYEFSFLATTKTFINAHPDIVRRMVLAQVLAIQYAQTHPTETLAALEKYYAGFNKTVVDQWMPIYISHITPYFNCQAVTNAVTFDVSINFIPRNDQVQTCSNLYTNQFVSEILGTSQAGIGTG